MLGTAYIKKAYTEANTAMKIDLHALNEGVRKNKQKVFPHLHFCFPLAFSVAFLVCFVPSYNRHCQWLPIKRLSSS